MFNSTYYKNESKVVAVTKEIEKTITPDKVTEMYDRVREQAEKDIISSLRVESNSLNGVVIQIQDHFSTATSRVHTRFVLNGEEHEATSTLDVKGVFTSEQLYQQLVTHYSDVVTGAILRSTPAFSKAWKILG